MNYYFACMKKYATFKGRARRSEFWYFYLTNLFIIASLYLIGGLIIDRTQSMAMVTFFDALNLTYRIFILTPIISVSVRRLHDVDKSGWLYALNLIPVIGFFILIVNYCKDGTPGENRFGQSPKHLSTQ